MARFSGRPLRLLARDALWSTEAVRSSTAAARSAASLLSGNRAAVDKLTSRAQGMGGTVDDVENATVVVADIVMPRP